MSFYQGRKSLSQRFRLVLLSVLQANGLPFSDVLTEAEIEEAFDDQDCQFAQADGNVFTPAPTLWAFLSQVLHKEEQRSCLAAVSRVIVLLVALGRGACANMVSGMAMGPYKGKETAEMALLRQLLDQLDGNDILLADRYYCSYIIIALLLNRNASLVARLRQLRKTDYQRARRLGKNDYLVTWPRPIKPSWMDEETYHQIPESLTLRLIDVKISEPGFHVESMKVVTTLTDAKQYTRDDIAELYHQRWLVELDIRATKCTLVMDVLRCKSPEMVRKEIWTCLLAYNLIRKTMLQVAKRHQLSPRQLSFATAMQTLAASWETLPTQDPATQLSLIEAQIDRLASQTVARPSRANRVEPRAVKCRPNPHRLLNMPREDARQSILKGVDPYDEKKN